MRKFISSMVGWLTFFVSLSIFRESQSKLHMYNLTMIAISTCGNFIYDFSPMLIMMLLSFRTFQLIKIHPYEWIFTVVKRVWKNYFFSFYDWTTAKYLVVRFESRYKTISLWLLLIYDCLGSVILLLRNRSIKNKCVF